MTLLFVVLSCFAVAAASPVAVAAFRQRASWVLALVPLAVFVIYCTWAGAIGDGEPITGSWSWVPALGIDFAFRVDGLSLLFGLLISGIGTLIVLYAGAYLADDPHLGRFLLFLFLFMGAMLGLTSADNVITLFVFWELTSISSYMLIGHKNEYQDSRDAALQALLVTGGGGLALLGGLVLLSIVAGTQDISAMAGVAEAIQSDDLYLPILLLVLLGAATKSAQFPFHFWLPGAMAAPTPVSAYLHSATMVKAGVYLLARFHPTLGGTTEWVTLVTTVGAVTFVVGAYLVINQFDLKKILAYSTVSALGLLVMLIGLGTDLALKGMVAFLLAHALYKGALFMIAGSIDHETGTRDIRQLGGLRALMPKTFVAALLAGLAIAGIPPFFAFIGKEVFLDAVLDADVSGQALLLIAVIVAAPAFVLAALLVVLGPFTGKAGETPKHAHEAPFAMWAGPLLLASAGLVAGVAPFLVQDWLIAPAVLSAAGQPVKVELALWHGLNLPLALSGLSIALGAGAFVARHQLRAVTMPIESRVAPLVGPTALYERALAGLKAGAALQVRVLQHGRLRRYVGVTALSAGALVGLSATSNGGFAISFDVGGVQFYEWFIAGALAAAAVVVAFAQGRLFAVAALGVVGVGNAAVFMLFGAPDLAMTQVLVDTLTVVLFVLVFYHLPAPMIQPSKQLLTRDVLIATAFGATMSILLLGAVHGDAVRPVSEYYAENSYLEAFGKNVVNVILVDFRALDTLGEILVLGIAAIGAFALLKLRPLPPKREDDAE